MKKYSIEEIDAYFQEYDGMAKALQIRVIEMSENHSLVSMPITEVNKNGLNSVHGGAVFTLADIAFGVACAGAGNCCVTAQSSLSYIKPGLVSPIFARCELINGGKKLMVYEMKVFDAKNILLAKGQITGYKLGSFEEFFQKSKEQKQLGARNG